MIKTYTSVSRSDLHLVGGEWLIAENNAGGSVINLSPEFSFEASDGYRGNFHVMTGNKNNTISVYDTTLGDENTAIARSRAGTVQLRWQEIFPGEQEKSYYSRPCRVVTDILPLENLVISQSGWLLLKMTRTVHAPCDFSFKDGYLGMVYLNFEWVLYPELPDPQSKSDFLPVAGLIFNSNDNTVEIIQQQFGPGTLWIPLSEPEASDSLSSSSSSDSVSEESSSSSISESASSDSVSSSSSSSESESISDEVVDIEVVMFYQEATDSLNSDGTTFVRYGTVNISGTFSCGGTYPAAGYTVVLNGVEIYDDGEGAGEQTQAAQHIMHIFRNDELDRWEFFDEYAFDWGDYLNYEDTANDISYNTPVYEYPQASSSPVYPLGAIRVDHHVVNGVSEPVPFYVLNSSLEITFRIKK